MSPLAAAGGFLPRICLPRFATLVLVGLALLGAARLDDLLGLPLGPPSTASRYSSSTLSASWRSSAAASISAVDRLREIVQGLHR